jgi:hypothetical protein
MKSPRLSIDGVDAAPAHVPAIHALQGSLALFVIAHFHRTDASVLIGKSICRNRYGFHFSEYCKRSPQLFLRRVEIQVAHIDIHSVLLKLRLPE